MNIYQNALTFWDDWFKRSSEIEPQKNDDPAHLGAPVLEEVLKRFITHKRMVLDYGCGNAWASIYLNYLNKDAKILALDQAPNGIEMSKKYALVNNCTDSLTFKVGDEEYLKTLPEGTFDGLFSSNVLDVIPMDITKRIVEELHRTIANNGELVIMINPYATPDLIAKIDFEAIGDNMYTKNGILRCHNLTSADWIKFFEAYFTVLDYQEFIFDDEDPNNKRRLFYMVNKK